jgi:hypothetical protein
MATSPIPSSSAAVEERALTQDEWWSLFDQLRLAQQSDYAEYGGSVAFFRKERDADYRNHHRYSIV